MYTEVHRDYIHQTWLMRWKWCGQCCPPAALWSNRWKAAGDPWLRSGSRASQPPPALPAAAAAAGTASPGGFDLDVQKPHISYYWQLRQLSSIERGRMRWRNNPRCLFCWSNQTDGCPWQGDGCVMSERLWQEVSIQRHSFMTHTHAYSDLLWSLMFWYHYRDWGQLERLTVTDSLQV